MNRPVSGKGKGDQYRKEMIAKVHIWSKELMICDKCRHITYCAECPNHKCNEKLGYHAKTRQVAETDYRKMLQVYTGKTSCRDMDYYELDKVLQVLKAAGAEEFVGGKKSGSRKTAATSPFRGEPVPGEGRDEGDYLSESIDETKNRMIKALEFKAKQRLGQHWYHRLHGYVEKAYKVQHLDKLTTKQLRGLFGFVGRA